MMKLMKTMHVDAKPDEVLADLLDPTFAPPGMTWAPVYEAPGEEGSVYEWTFKVAGVPQRGVMIVTEYEPGRRLSTLNLGAVESNSTMTFEPENEGSRVTMDVESQLTMPLIGRFLDSFLEKGMLKNTEWMMRQIEERHAKKEPSAT